MKRGFRQFFAAALTVLLLCATLPATALAETSLASSGEINGFTYEWDDARKELTLTGDGELDLSGITVDTDEVESVIIKGDVQIIGPGCFENWRNLRTVELPESLIAIEDRAFADCSRLMMVELPEDLHIIGDDAFSHCVRLELRRLPKRLIEIGRHAFFDCLSLALTELPESLESIGNYAFYNCEGLTNLTVPASLERIGRHAFYGCDDLTLRFLGMTAPTVENYTLENVKEIQVPIGSTGYDAAHGWPEDKIQYVFSGGSTEENPYRIMDKAQLKAFRDYINDGNGAGEYFLLAADIDLGGEEWTPIGSDSATGFQGMFDGGGHTVMNMSITGESIYSSIGFFGYVGKSATVKNLKVTGEINATNGTPDGGDVGGIVGNCSGTIENCENDVIIAATGFSSVGGIAGDVSNGHISSCANTGSVTGNGYVGGVVGHAAGTIENCENAAAIAATGSFAAGGIVGSGLGDINDCANTGTVTGESTVGGIMGSGGAFVRNCGNSGAVMARNSSRAGGVVGVYFSHAPSTGAVYYVIENCYNTGSVTAGDSGSAGGIAGSTCNIKNCYNTGTVSGGGNAGGILVDNEDKALVENCYYLDTCGAGGKGTAKTADEFSSGEVAYLLQAGQSAQIWGQTVGSDYPELTGDAEKKVCQVTFRADLTPEYEKTLYANPGGTLPEVETLKPEKDGYTFVKWALTDSQEGEAFTASTQVNSDLTLYAIFEEKATEPAPTESKDPKPSETEASRDPTIKPSGEGPNDHPSGTPNDTPKTGDEGQLYLWLALVLLSLAGAAVTAPIMGRKRPVGTRKANERE